MRRPILANANAIMRQNIHDVGLHQCAKTDGVAHIIAEHKEGSTERTHTAMQRHTVAHRRHGKFADAEVYIAPFAAFRGEPFLSLQNGVVGGAQVSAAAKQVGHHILELIEHIAGSRARSDGLIVYLHQFFNVHAGRHTLGKSFLIRFITVRILRFVSFHHRNPFFIGLSAFFYGFSAMVIHFLGHGKRLFQRPLNGLAERSYIFGPQRRSVGFFTAFQRCAAGNFGIHQNKRGFASLLGLANGICNGVDVIAVYIVDGMPAIGTIPRCDIFVEGNGGVALDGDAVAIVQNNELIQLLRTGKGAGLGGNAFL